MYISTLRSYVEAMGGDLQSRAVLPDGEVQIKQFQDVATELERPTAHRQALR